MNWRMFAYVFLSIFISVPVVVVGLFLGAISLYRWGGPVACLLGGLAIFAAIIALIEATSE